MHPACHESPLKPGLGSEQPGLGDPLLHLVLPAPPLPPAPCLTGAQEALGQQALGQAAAPLLGQELGQVLKVEDEHNDGPILILHGHHIHEAAEAGGCKHRGEGVSLEGSSPAGTWPGEARE